MVNCKGGQIGGHWGGNPEQQSGFIMNHGQHLFIPMLCGLVLLTACDQTTHLRGQVSEPLRRVLPRSLTRQCSEREMGLLFTKELQDSMVAYYCGLSESSGPAVKEILLQPGNKLDHLGNIAPWINVSDVASATKGGVLDAYVGRYRKIRIEGFMGVEISLHLVTDPRDPDSFPPVRWAVINDLWLETKSGWKVVPEEDWIPTLKK